MLINVTARYYLNKHLDASSLGVLGLHVSFKIHNNIVLFIFRFIKSNRENETIS